MVPNQGKYILKMTMNNKFIKVLQTRKYKDINLYLRYSLHAKENLKEELLLLSKLIGDRSKNYPNKTLMSKVKDMLYGINLDVSYKARANIFTLTFHYSFINPKFVDVSINDYINFINETLNNTLINESTLKEAKDILIDVIKRSEEKPSSYSSQRFNEIVSKDNKDFDIYYLGKKTIPKIKKINVKELNSLYKQIINKAQLNIYLCGDLDDETIMSLTAYDFSKRKEVIYKPSKYKYQKIKDVVDKKDTGQSVLYSTYATPFNKKHRDFFAWFVGNCFLGNVPVSLLFEEIREKLSLCYSIGVIDYKNDGLVRIATFIDADKKDIVLKEIDNQIQRIINKDYDFNKLEMAKLLLSNSLMSIYDDFDALIDYYHESYLSDFNYSIEEYCENIMKVNPDDLVRVFKQYKPYFNYMLLGENNEKEIL